jgi:flagellar motor switch protein FliG
VLQNALGEQKYLEVLDEVKQDTFDKDPFQKIRDADPGKLTMALQGESPQVVGIVLAELDGDTSMTLLGQLDADTRDDVVKSMTFGQNVAAETRTRIAGVIDKRLKELDDEGVEAGAANPQLQKYRRVAVMIRGLGNELRMKMLDDLAKTNKEAAEGVSKMMVIWEDMATVPDRAMAEVLRGINSKKLALALVDADADTTKKMRENISERASAMLDEEADLLTNPKPTEVDAAREEVLEALRELNSQGFVY